LIISTGPQREPTKSWVFKTYRGNADGTGAETVKIPPEDGVFDWSADGDWLLTSSSRKGKNGWGGLYVMRLDGTDQRQLAEGGCPIYARFSPDGRQVMYLDGYPARFGVWVVGVDDKDGRRIFKLDTLFASASWSPDGERIAVAVEKFPIRPDPDRRMSLEVMDSRGEHRVSLALPPGTWPYMYMCEWR
jgi:Tol biopolymer transport system component